MSSQPSVPVPKRVAAVTRVKFGITFVGYALLLMAAIESIPLRIPEVLQIAGIRKLAPSKFFDWIAQAPGSSPLNPLLQLPSVSLGGHSRLAVRFVSLVFAVAACYLFLRLARRIPIERPYWALLLFMLLPMHFELSFVARPFEQALFLVVLATECFLRLVSRPGMKTAFVYGACLTLCLYTDRYSLLPFVGYLLFLLRFINRTSERRASGYALAATAVPVLLFLPYAVWARTDVNANWFAGTPALARWAAYVLSILLTTGVLVGAWGSFRVTGGAIAKRIRVFVLAGGICCTILIAVALHLSLGERFTSSQVLWMAPATVILLFAGLEWLAKRSGVKSLALVGAMLLLAICALADAQFLFFPDGSVAREDLQAIAAAVPGQLKRDACVVFVSEKFSKAMFLVFEPELEPRECLEFFHSRIVLASHPYVTAAQQQDAESYFRGLNMVETQRLRVGGGQIVVMQQQGK